VFSEDQYAQLHNVKGWQSRELCIQMPALIFPNIQSRDHMKKVYNSGKTSSLQTFGAVTDSFDAIEMPIICLACTVLFKIGQKSHYGPSNVGLNQI
jgi:hypothetical protein